MKGEAFRRIALGLEGAIEGAHMSHPRRVPGDAKAAKKR